jgi:hypothetical protein
MNTFEIAPLDPKTLLLKLIENDIYSGQLINGLSEIMRLEAADYLLRLSDLIFQMLGYPPDEIPDEVSDIYFELVRKASVATLGTNWKYIPEMAAKICEELQNLYLESLRQLP